MPQRVPTAKVIEVEPVSSDDWEVLEQNSGHLEEELLNQVSLEMPSIKEWEFVSSVIQN